MPQGRGTRGCAGCLELFSSTSAFDRHFTFDPDRGDTATVHHDPESRGLVLRDVTIAGEVWGIWGWPTPDAPVDFDKIHGREGS